MLNYETESKNILIKLISFDWFCKFNLQQCNASNSIYFNKIIREIILQLKFVAVFKFLKCNKT